jgi:hypothetical protein
MPLFASQPQTPDDISQHTALKDTVALFAQFLHTEGKSIHTIRRSRRICSFG